MIDTREALRMAREAGLDLVEVNPNSRPPVCKIMDYGKWKYQQKKNIRKHHEQQIKEVRLRPKTDQHDREIKFNRALRFLHKGDKVQFKMVFRGRERAHREIGFDIFKNIIEQLGELVKIERPPSMDGRDLLMVVSPNKAALDKLAADKHPALSGKLPDEHDQDDEQDEHDDGDEGDHDAPQAGAAPATSPAASQSAGRQDA